MAFIQLTGRKQLRIELPFRSGQITVRYWTEQNKNDLFTFKIQQECDVPAANRNRSTRLRILLCAGRICPSFFPYFDLQLVVIIESIWQTQADFGIRWINKQRGSRAVGNCVTFEYNVTYLRRRTN